MAFPSFAGSLATTDSGAVISTPFTVNLPAGITAGELLLMLISDSVLDDSMGPAASGWTLLGHANTSGNNGHGTLFYRIADGSEGSTVTVTFTATNSSRMSAMVRRITNWHSTTPPEATIVAGGASTTPDPGALTPSWGAADTLWVAMVAGDSIFTGTTGYPATYADNREEFSPTNNPCVAWATRNLNAASDDPGTFTVSASVLWVTFTVAVRPASALGVTWLPVHEMSGNPRPPAMWRPLQ